MAANYVQLTLNNTHRYVTPLLDILIRNLIPRSGSLGSRTAAQSPGGTLQMVVCLRSRDRDMIPIYSHIIFKPSPCSSQ